MFRNVEIDAIFIIAQIVGFMATVVAISSFQAKRRIDMLALQIVANLLWLVHYFMLGSMSAAVANFIGTVRNIFYSMRGKYRFADSKLIPAASIVAFIVSGIFTYQTPFDVFPTLAMILASIAFYVKEENLIRFINIFIASFWLSFGIYAGSIASIISDGGNLVSIIVAITRYRSLGLYNSLSLADLEDEKSQDKQVDKAEENYSDNTNEDSTLIPYSYD